MPNEKILVIDDEEGILELIAYNFKKEGYRVVTADSGERGLKAAREGGFDLIILDLMLPGIDGLDVCKILKSEDKTAHIPIIMLTARGEDIDMVTGLDLGADDYIPKPFSPRVLLAKLKAVLRRKLILAEDKTHKLKRGVLLLDIKRRQVTINDRPVELTFTEFGILQFLATRPGNVYNRQQIISAVKGDDYPVNDRSVDVQIVNLRRKLGEAGMLIETVRGAGYRFKH